MKITRKLAAKLIEESASFRQFILDELFDSMEEFRTDIISYLKGNRSQKIECIKYIRLHDYKALAAAFPNFSFDIYYSEGQRKNIISLKAGKEFVELMFDEIDSGKYS